MSQRNKTKPPQPPPNTHHGEKNQIRSESAPANFMTVKVMKCTVGRAAKSRTRERVAAINRNSIRFEKLKTKEDSRTADALQTLVLAMPLSPICNIADEISSSLNSENVHNSFYFLISPLSVFLRTSLQHEIFVMDLPELREVSMIILH
jgi:hypothetical protein